MGGDDKLTAEKAHSFLKKLGKLLLIFRRKAVFRLVKQIKRIFMHSICEKGKRTFAVGIFLYIAADGFAHKLRNGVAANAVLQL